LLKNCWLKEFVVGELQTKYPQQGGTKIQYVSKPPGPTTRNTVSVL
jgi:hypothetical protein